MGPSATELIRSDHEKVLEIFHRYSLDARPGAKRALVGTACALIELHSAIEEEVFYPALAHIDPEIVDRSVPEHAAMRLIIEALRATGPVDADYDRLFLQLMRTVMHHMAEEETTLLPDAERSLGSELFALGARMRRERRRLAAPRLPLYIVGTAALIAGSWLLYMRPWPPLRLTS